MTETTWDTEETSRIIANDDGLYNRAIRLARNAYSIGRLAQLMEDEFSDIIEANPYSEIDINCIEWTEIASEYLGDDEYTDAEE